MKLTKFERRKRDLLKKHQEELAVLAETERKERAKLINPVIDKLSKVAAEEARKILEKNPDILEEYSFKKRDAAKAISTCLMEHLQGSSGKVSHASGDGKAHIDGDEGRSEPEVANKIFNPQSP